MTAKTTTELIENLTHAAALASAYSGGPLSSKYNGELKASQSILTLHVAAIETARNELLTALRIHHRHCIRTQREYSDTGGDRVAYRATLLAIAKGMGVGAEYVEGIGFMEVTPTGRYGKHETWAQAMNAAIKRVDPHEALAPGDGVRHLLRLRASGQ